MRSSNGRHYAKEEAKNSGKLYSKLGSVVVAAVIAIAAIVIPGTTIVQNVEAVTNLKNSVFEIGGTQAFSDVIVKKCVSRDLREAKTEKKTKVAKKTMAKPVAVVAEKPTEVESVAVKETTVAVSNETQPVTEPPAPIQAEKSSALLSITSADPDYSPQHITLSSVERDKLERLVMGEAGTLGYTGCALIAQAVRDSMLLSGTTSVDAIISDYQYTAPLTKKPNSAAKKAVAYIFDNDGYAVQHRILYFYASNYVDNAWHESQKFIVSYGNVRFFDKW